MKAGAAKIAMGRDQMMAEKAMARSNLYGLLAFVYREEPTEDFLRQIRAPCFVEALRDAGIVLEEAFLKAAEGALLHDLAVEYARLFIGPGKHISPHESVHTEGALWGKATCDVKRVIEGSGFDYQPGYRGIPDHISVELEFMQQLTRMESEAWRHRNEGDAANCVSIEEEFIGSHLDRWLPLFCKTVEKEAKRPFYREMAKLTRDFIQREKEEIT